MHRVLCFWHQPFSSVSEREPRGLDSHLYLSPLAAAVTDHDDEDDEDDDDTKQKTKPGRPDVRAEAWGQAEPELVIKTWTTDVGGRRGEERQRRLLSVSCSEGRVRVRRTDGRTQLRDTPPRRSELGCFVKIGPNRGKGRKRRTETSMAKEF